jgi:hypothetical protein
MRLSIEEQIELFKKAIDRSLCDHDVYETNDGYITNGIWAVRKEFLRSIPYQEYLSPKYKSYNINCLDYVKNLLKKSVKVYHDFDYYAVRTETFEIFETTKTKQIYILDIPELFKKVGISKVYADFIEGVVCCSLRKLYIIEFVDVLNKKANEAHFVWFDANDRSQINAVCAGSILE